MPIVIAATVLSVFLTAHFYGSAPGLLAAIIGGWFVFALSRVAKGTTLRQQAANALREVNNVVLFVLVLTFPLLRSRHADTRQILGWMLSIGGIALALHLCTRLMDSSEDVTSH